MKRKRFITLALLAYAQITLGSQIYISKDKYGNLLYSDTPPPQGQYESSRLVTIPTTKWTTTPKIKNPYSTGSNNRSSKPNNQISDRKKRCTQLRSALNKIEKRLSQRNNAATFNQLKDKLNSKRKVYRKMCT